MKNSNSISIKAFLAKRGINPRMKRGGYGMYLSPYRVERTPSFKVDYSKNLWYDFGVGEGGSIIDLVMRMDCCSLAEAFKRLDEGQFGHEVILNQREQLSPKPPTQIITEVKELAHPNLLAYLKSRKINLRAAKEYCQEVHYEQNGKQYFAIGFRNDTAGKKALSELQKLDVEVVDKSTIYHEFKDMNEYLIALSREPLLQQRVNMFF